MNKQYYGKQHCANMKLFDKIDLLLCFVKDPVICETIVILSHRELMLCPKPKSVAATVPWLISVQCECRIESSHVSSCSSINPTVARTILSSEIILVKMNGNNFGENEPK